MYFLKQKNALVVPREEAVHKTTDAWGLQQFKLYGRATNRKAHFKKLMKSCLELTQKQVGNS